MARRKEPDRDLRFDPEVRKGTTETIVLAVLADPAHEAGLHGYGLIVKIRELSEDRFILNEGALYPLLHRLEREKKLRSRTSTVRGRQRKTYALTDAGRIALAEQHASWSTYVAFMKRVLTRSRAST